MTKEIIEKLRVSSVTFSLYAVQSSAKLDKSDDLLRPSDPEVKQTEMSNSGDTYNDYIEDEWNILNYLTPENIAITTSVALVGTYLIYTKLRGGYGQK